MKPENYLLSRTLSYKLTEFGQRGFHLPGITSVQRQGVLVSQLVDSIRRIKYVEVIRDKEVSDIYANPEGHFYDPLKATSWFRRNGQIDEAFWQIFLSTHFGRSKRSSWNLSKEIYRGTGSGGLWTWERVSDSFLEFRDWLHVNQQRLRQLGTFGNHRKYQSLDAYSPVGTGMAIGSYIEWIGDHHQHEYFFSNAENNSEPGPVNLFAHLYQSMSEVVSFGRTAKFDYLTMVGKFQLAHLSPGTACLEGSTGPRRGAKLLFGGSTTASLSDNQLENMLAALNGHLDLYFGMQVLEDALCNWQKSPDKYQYFRG
jgi:Alpha-glutamyl/putrescinyl thymine pyrophosphorylase clade 3